MARLAPTTMRWGYIAANVVTLASGALLPVALKRTIDGVAGSRLSVAVTGIALASLAACGSDSGDRAQKDLMVYFTNAGGHQVSVRIARIVSGLPSLEHLERPDHQDQVQMLNRQGEAIASTLTNGFRSVRLMIGLLISVALLASVDPLLMLFPLFVLPSLRLIPKVHAVREQGREEAAEHERAALHVNALFSDINAAMEMRVFGASAALDEEAHRRWQLASEAQAHAEARAASLSMMGLGILALGYLTALGLVAWRTTGGIAAAGSAVMVIQLAQQLRLQLEGSINIGQQLRSAVEVLDRLVWLENFRPAGFDTDATATPPDKVRDGIVLDSVTFRYPGSDRDVLTDISVALRAGSVVAVVGDNGAGKTTFVKLLCGFYRPSSGQIAVDGTDLATIRPDAWQRRVAGAFQDYLRLEDAFRYSIIPGRDVAPDDEVEAAARRGDALALTTSWAGGFDTHVGKTYRDGLQLSGGEWQRVAVARAMQPDDPLLLVLDEPTAAFDPSAEHRLYQHYSEASRRARENSGCVTVLISHRFSTVRMADRILVFSDGKVTEDGTHDVLLARGGAYAHLYLQQASAYADSAPKDA